MSTVTAPDEITTNMYVHPQSVLCLQIYGLCYHLTSFMYDVLFLIGCMFCLLFRLFSIDISVNASNVLIVAMVIDRCFFPILTCLNIAFVVVLIALECSSCIYSRLVLHINVTQSRNISSLFNLKIFFDFSWTAMHIQNICNYLPTF